MRQLVVPCICRKETEGPVVKQVVQVPLGVWTVMSTALKALCGLSWSDALHPTISRMMVVCPASNKQIVHALLHMLGVMVKPPQQGSLPA